MYCFCIFTIEYLTSVNKPKNNPVYGFVYVFLVIELVPNIYGSPVEAISGILSSRDFC